MAVVNQLSIGGSLYDINDKRNLYDLMYPVGSVYVCSTNTNPSSKFGGTWTLIDKKFKYKRVTYSDIGSYLTLNTTNVTSIGTWGDITWLPDGIFFRFPFTNKVNYATTTTYPIFTFTKANLGVNNFPNSYYDVQVANKAPIVHIALNNDDSRFEVRGCTATPGASSTINFVFFIPLNYERKLDAWCDQFYFKRTA